MFPFHHSLMSSCSCQHLLIACNSSLRVTAGAVGLGPAPPAIGCTQRESLARAGASLAPSPHLGLTTLQRIPQPNPGAARLALSPSCSHWGTSAGGSVGSISLPDPVPRRCCGAAGGWGEGNKALLPGGRMAVAVPAAPAGCNATRAATTQSFYS